MLKLSKLLGIRGSALDNGTLELGGTKSGVATEVQSQPATRLNPRWKAKLVLIAPVLISVVLSIFGQTILKKGMSNLGPVSISDRGIFNIIWSLATDPFILGGMTIFAASVLFWLVGLSRVALSYAYPLISLSYVAILATSYFILGEQLNPVRVLGVLVICAGVIMVALTDPHEKRG